MTTTTFGSLGEPSEQTQIRVRKAARCLPRHGLGNGVVVAGATIEEAEARNTGTGRIYERMWDYLTDGDPE